MADLKQPTNQSQPTQNEPRMKTPPAVNPFNRAKDLEDDVPVVKQDIANPQKDSNPNVIHSHQPSLDKPTLKEAIPGATTYDPYSDLKKGKTEEEVIHKLKDENSKLRRELKSISDDLTVLLEKKKTKKTYKKENLVKNIVSNSGTSETNLRAELETVQKQLVTYQKELDKMKGKFAAQATYEKYEELQDNIRENEAKIKEVTGLKRDIEKTLREKERLLDSLYAEADVNTKLKTLTEELRINRERVKEAEKRKEMLESQVPKRQDYLAKLAHELMNLKKEVERIQQKTGYQHQEVNKAPSYLSKSKAGSDRNAAVKSKKIPISQPQEEEELEFNEENFAKLQKEFKVLQKAERTRGEKNEKDLAALQEQLAALEGSDLKQKIAEKEKEIALLTAKTKEISRIVRHQAVAPLRKEEELNAKETSLSTKEDMRSLLGRKEGSSSPTKFRSSSKAKKEPVPVKRPQPYHLLVQYAKQNFQSKGFRKDERGKPVAEDEGENFNDKDIVGQQKVKIIAVDVWYDDQKITGIQAVYENDKGEIIEGGPHVANPENAKMVTFETLEEDYLKEISGFMNKSESMIECLIMKTFRGEVMKIGQPSKDSKQFNFDINELEYPAILYGSVKVDGQNNGRLTRLGVLISADPIEERIGHRENKDHKAENTEGNQEKVESEKVEEEGVKEGSNKSLKEGESKKSLSDAKEHHESKKPTEKDIKSPKESVNDVDGPKVATSRKEASQVIQEQHEREEKKMTSRNDVSRNEVDGGESSYRVGKVISQREN